MFSRHQRSKLVVIAYVFVTGAGLAACGGVAGPSLPAANDAAGRSTSEVAPRLGRGLPTLGANPAGTAAAAATAAPTATPVPAPSRAPTATPAPRLSVAATQAPARSTLLAYDPTAGTAAYFPSSPFTTKIPNPPTVNAHNSHWADFEEKLGTFKIADFHAYTSRAANPYEIAFPIYLNHQGTDSAARIHCTSNFGGASVPCNIEGDTVYVDPSELPQNGGNPAGGHEDAHWGLIDPVLGYEYTTWKTQWPPKNGVLTVGWGGRCSLGGNGFTNPSYAGPAWNRGCGSTASSTPLSLGIVRAKDLLLAASTGGSLPAALNVDVGCSGTAKPLVTPFPGGGDGRCADAPPEGSRFYLAMHDADVNKLRATPIVGALLRTLDEDHFGGFMTDSGTSASAQIDINVESDSTYAAFGQGTPWLTQFVPEARREGLNVYSVISQQRIGITMSLPAAIGWSKMRFL